MKIRLTIFISCFLTTMLISQTTYYVSSTLGNDSLNGLSTIVNGLNGPWKTLTKISNSSFNAGDTILLRRGDTWAETLSINSSGITVGAYGSENPPMINGADTITNWSLYNNTYNIWVASLNTTSSVTQVFIGGERQTLARWPNIGWENISINSSNHTSLQSNELNQSANYWVGCNVIYRYYWAFTEGHITSSSTGTLTFTNSQNGYNPVKDWGFYIEGKFEELDTLGEYYWDNTMKLLYIVLPLGSNPNNFVIEASLRDNCIYASFKNNVLIKDISIKNAANIGIYFENCNNSKISNCNILFSKQHGILLRRTTGSLTNLTIERCNISQVDGGGGGQFASGITSSSYISNLKILNNTISDIASEFASPRWGTGIYLGAGASNTLVEGNTITRTSNNGIHLARLSGPHNITRNTIHDCITLLDDAGGIYVNGDQTGTIIEYNRISDCLGSKEGAPFTYVPLTMGLYSDAYDNFGTLYRNNIVSGCTYGALIHMSRNTTLYNNTFFNNKHGIYLSEKAVNQMYGNVIKNNICLAINSSQYPITIGRFSGSTGSIGTLNYNLYYNLVNNIAVRYISSNIPTNLSLSQWKNKTGLDSGNDTNSLSTNPLLLDVTNNNFLLTPSSPCIDTGTNVGSTNDFIGTHIPIGIRPDIGAYEYFSDTNNAPIANAGSTQIVNEGTIVTLNGSNSYDPDGDTITYLWIPPLNITLSSIIISTPSFTAPQVNTDTQYTFSLIVNDGKLNSSVSQVVITVKNGMPPIAGFTANTTDILVGSSVDFIDLSSNTPTSWSWDFAAGAPSGSCTPATSTNQNLTVTYNLPGVYNVKLTVSNAYGNDSIEKTDFITVNLNVKVNVIEKGYQELVIFPNPADGIITFNIEALQDNKGLIKIFDAIGNLIIETPFESASNYSIDLSHLSNGVYIVNIVTLEDVYVDKILIQK